MGFPPGGSRGAIMCQFVAFHPEKPPLSRRTVDCRVIFCRERDFAAWNASKRPVSFRSMPVTSGPRDRVRKHDLDQGAGTAAGLDLEFGAVGFDKGFGQRQVDG